MITFCISTYNNLEYLKIAIESVRKNSYYKDAPFVIHAENCTDGTDEWLASVKEHYNLDVYIDKNDSPKGIGGGMNYCADRVKTEYIMFLHSDFYVTKDWDRSLLHLFDKYPNERLWVNSARIEPQMFPGSQTTPGNIVVPQDAFGAYYDSFDTEIFDKWSEEFKEENDIEYTRGLGVSALIKKRDWDFIGGNDPIFAPTSWDDHDLFWRMYREGFKFVTTTKSLVYHFGARGSHRLEENNNTTSERQSTAERVNAKKFVDKWGGMPEFDSQHQICGIKGRVNKVSLIIPSDGTNRDYTLNLLNNIKSLYGNDDTIEVIDHIDNVTLGVNYNNAIAKATGDIVVLLHNDMILKEGFVEKIRRDITPNTVLTYTRVEPPKYPDTYPGKVILDCGYSLDDFDKDKWGEFEVEDKVIDGGSQLFFAVFKRDYIGIDGHTFVKFREDDDIMLRYDIAGFNKKVSSAAVYHFGSKTSRRGEWQAVEHHSHNKFINKWGIVNGRITKNNPIKIF
tara:strand:- start:3534 stop:5057 length:1524 start_codon:yes stop_codon:yes gene_type:complete